MRAVGREAAGNGFAGGADAAGRQSPKCFSSSGRSVSAATSPVTISVALSGRIQSRWNATSSSRVSAAIDASVPDPVNGIAYGWPSPYSSGGSTR